MYHALDMRCPTCGALPGEPCHRSRWFFPPPRFYHRSRELRAADKNRQRWLEPEGTEEG